MLKYCRFYNKIVIPLFLFGVTISRAISICLRLHIKSAINMDVIIRMYRYYIVDMLNILSDGLTPLLMLLLCWSGVY